MRPIWDPSGADRTQVGPPIGLIMITSSNENFFRVTDHLCGEFPVNSLHKGQWRGALMFSLICVWINSWVNNREAGDLRRHRGHYGPTVMWTLLSGISWSFICLLCLHGGQYSPVSIWYSCIFVNIKFTLHHYILSYNVTAFNTDVFVRHTVSWSYFNYRNQLYGFKRSTFDAHTAYSWIISSTCGPCASGALTALLRTGTKYSCFTFSFQPKSYIFTCYFYNLTSQ